MAVSALQTKSINAGIVSKATYIDSIVLVAAVAQQITIPATARYIEFKSEVPFYALFGANPTAAIAAINVTDGSGSDYCPDGIFDTDGAAKVSLISRLGGVITICYYN